MTRFRVGRPQLSTPVDHEHCERWGQNEAWAGQGNQSSCYRLARAKRKTPVTGLCG